MRVGRFAETDSIQPIYNAAKKCLLKVLRLLLLVIKGLDMLTFAYRTKYLAKHFEQLKCRLY